MNEHQGLPIPEQRGPHKSLIPPPCQPQNLWLCWLHPGEPLPFLLWVAGGQTAQEEGPCEAESTPQEETYKWPVLTTQGVFLS